MAKTFTKPEWRKINDLLDQSPDSYDFPERRTKSLIFSSFNIRKIGTKKGRDADTWTFLARYCQQCDLVAIQEVQDNLDGLKHLKDLLNEKSEEWGMVASDITGGWSGRRGMVERLAFLFRWKRVERTEVASDVTIDRSRVLGTIHDKRIELWKDLEDRTRDLAEFAAKKALGKRPRSPPFVLSQFVTFIRTPLCVSFRAKAKGNARPYEFLAVNAHLLYGDARKQAHERELEFQALIHWLISRSKQASRMYHKDILLLGDLNLDFEDTDGRREVIENQIKSYNGGALKGKKSATVNFPFITEHPERAFCARPCARRRPTTTSPSSRATSASRVPRRTSAPARRWTASTTASSAIRISSRRRCSRVTSRTCRN